MLEGSDAYCSEVGLETNDDESAEKAWMEALGMEEEDDGSVFDEDEKSVRDDVGDSDDDEDESMTMDDEKDLKVSQELELEAVLGEYDDDAKLLFSSTQLDILKEKEKVLLERRKHGYYRNKEQHKNAYAKISKAFAPYITRDMLAMLHHNWSTQRNEAMNKSVTSFAPKDKTFSLTTSLLTRVNIAGAMHNKGNHTVWNEVYDRFNLAFDANLSNNLLRIDRKKNNQAKAAATREGKLRRGRKRLEKMQTAQRQDIKAQKEGLEYTQGVALRQATKDAKANNTFKTRNPEGTNKSEYRCKFNHPKYCTHLGHSSCASPKCFMHKKSKVERDAASDFILKERIQQNLMSMQANRKYIFHMPFQIYGLRT
jgi:hypothetical protein